MPRAATSAALLGPPRESSPQVGSHLTQQSHLKKVVTEPHVQTRDQRNQREPPNSKHWPVLRAQQSEGIELDGQQQDQGNSMCRNWLLKHLNFPH